MAEAFPSLGGRYLLRERLGAGSMGVVYAARDVQLDRDVALKLAAAHAGSDAGDKLLGEAKALARLAHPNVVTVYDAGVLDGQAYIAMQLASGVSLWAWLRQRRRHPREVLAAFVDAGRGLGAAHEAGEVHRDFKPENVMVGPDGRVQLLDFGLSRAGFASVHGTPAYMAPEQMEGQPSDHRTDQFSFCVALWEALFGRRPFAGDTHWARYNAMDAGELQRPSRHVPRRLLRALERGLQRRPEDRWPSMAALLDELERSACEPPAWP